MPRTAVLKTVAVCALALGLALGGRAFAAWPPPPHSGSSPWGFSDLERPNSTFVVADRGPSLDRYTFRNQPPIIIQVPIRRYVAATAPTGRLANIDELVERGIVGRTVRIRLPAYDVDANSFPIGDCDGDGIPDQIRNEVDKLYLNGEFVGELKGDNDIWLAQSFDVPIDILQFPRAQGEVAMNTFTVDIDTANRDVVLSSGAVGCNAWAVSIDWIGLKFEAASPVVMVHGIRSSGEAFDNFLLGLEAENVKATDNSISLTDPPAPDPIPVGCPNIPYNNSIQHNINQLRNRVYHVAERLGSESLHFVTHSKGGLDTRGFLSSTVAHPLEVTVGTMGGGSIRLDLEGRSLVTLNTPHQGSVLAKYGVEARQLTWMQALRESVNVSAAKGLEGAYYCDLTPARASAFVGATTLPSSVQAASVATDADTNDNGAIDEEEGEGFTGGSSVADRLYQLVGNTLDVTITVTPGEWMDEITITETPTAEFRTNDVVVPQPSAAQYTTYPIDNWHHENVHSQDNALTITQDAHQGGLVNWRFR